MLALSRRNPSFGCEVVKSQVCWRGLRVRAGSLGRVGGDCDRLGLLLSVKLS